LKRGGKTNHGPDRRPHGGPYKNSYSRPETETEKGGRWIKTEDNKKQQGWEKRQKLKTGSYWQKQGTDVV